MSGFPLITVPIQALVRRLKHAVVAAVIGLTLAAGAVTAAHATAIPGADAPAFVAALEQWLDDDEGPALTALSELAQGGNPAAQLLLALIEKSADWQGPFLARLQRGARIALLRAPGGLSGRSWLGQIDGVPLANAWRRLLSTDAGPALIEAFTALDEPRAARQALIVLAAREHPDLALLDPAAIDPELLYLRWRSATGTERGVIADLVAREHPQRLMMGETVTARALDRWLADSASARPLAALCDFVCPEDIGICLGAAYRALNSHDALLALGTPVEALVSQAEFLDSPRGRASVMRRILLATATSHRRAMLARVATESTCLGAALSAESDRYRMILPGVANDG